MYIYLYMYSRADAQGVSSDPDLHYNKASVHRCLEEYEQVEYARERACARERGPVHLIRPIAQEGWVDSAGDYARVPLSDVRVCVHYNKASVHCYLEEYEQVEYLLLRNRHHP